MELLYKILDILRYVFVVVIIGMLGYKYLHPSEIHLELNSYLQTIIFILIAVEAFRMFGPKQN